jgi:hypothetical protein
MPPMGDALFDNYLLQHFPGKTLEELDNMNVLRWMRAMDARNIESVEEIRKDQIKGKKKASDIPDKVLKQFLKHDELFEEFENYLNGK